jgi:glycosyltransferase involved in cell wall biosynthesis
MALVFAGGTGWMMQDFNGLLEHLGIRDQCVFTGYVSDQELVWLYRHCFAHLYPSSFEGFGLPVIEGFNFGAPTILSDADALREIGIGAALSVPAGDTSAWARAMLRLSREAELRGHLSREAQKRAERFSWQRSARDVTDLYAEAVSLPKRNHS